MRRLIHPASLLAIAIACWPFPRAAAAVQSSPGRGTIPITTRSSAARALYLRGRATNENLQPHEAHALFRQAVALDPSFALGEYGLAITSATAKETAEHLEKALRLAEHASLGERLLILGFKARSHGDPDVARQVAESLVVHYPKDERAHWTLGSISAAQQMYHRAITEFQAAIALNPRYALAYNQLGYAYRSAGQLTAAEAAFRQYITLVPDDPNPYDSYAELLMLTGRFDESIRQYRKAQSIDEHFTGSFVGIAANEMFAGRYDRAVAELERYHTMARDDRERRAALVALAMTYVDQAATDKALDAMERRIAIAAAGGDTVNMAADGVLMADILLEAGRLEAARMRFAQAHELLAASSVADDLKRDDALGTRYDAARLALASGDLASARAEAAVYLAGAMERRNDTRIRQAHELNGLVALAAKQFDVSLAELALADQHNPAVMFASARAYAGLGDSTKASVLADQARRANELPTFPAVFTRAALAAATRSATSGNAHEKPR